MQNLFGDFFGTLEVIQGFVPSGIFRLVVEAPRARPLAWGGTQRAEAARDRDGRPARVRLPRGARRRARGGAGHAARGWSSPTSSRCRRTATWDALGAWYERMVAPQLVLDDELQRIASGSEGGASDEADLVRRLYEYVVTSTRYVGIELGHPRMEAVPGERSAPSSLRRLQGQGFAARVAAARGRRAREHRARAHREPRRHRCTAGVDVDVQPRDRLRPVARSLSGRHRRTERLA